MVVLDRPNPLGLSWQGKADGKWRRVEGNILDTKWHSFVGWYPIPLRCGAFVLLPLACFLTICFLRADWAP